MIVGRKASIVNVDDKTFANLYPNRTDSCLMTRFIVDKNIQ